MEAKNPVLPALGKLLLLGSLVLSGCGQKPGVGGGMPGTGGPAEVGVVTVQPQAVHLTTELSGRTSANVIAEIRPQVGGIVQQRFFREGGDVKAGELLYQIDAASYQATMESAKAAQAKAEANLTTLRLKAERYQELAAVKAVSQQAYDDAVAAVKTAEADVAGAKAAVESARINLGYTHLVSPISGRIGRSTVTQGALVTANQATALATVQQLDPINVDVTQSSVDLLRLRREMAAGRVKGSGDLAKVKLLLEDGSAYPLEGKLAFSEATVDASTGSITLRASFPNPKGELLPGMYVRAVLEQGVKENAIVVPQQGLTRTPKGDATVMVVKDGKVEARVVKAEQAMGDKWLVSEGLQAGDQVIVEGVQRARPGSPVNAVPAGSPPAGIAGKPAGKPAGAGGAVAASAPAAKQ